MTKVEKKIVRPGTPLSVSVKVSVKVKVKAKWGSVQNFGGGMPPKIFDTPSFGFDFDFDWDFDWDNPIFLTQVSGLAIRISKGSKNEVGLRL